MTREERRYHRDRVIQKRRMLLIRWNAVPNTLWNKLAKHNLSCQCPMHKLMACKDEKSKAKRRKALDAEIVFNIQSYA